MTLLPRLESICSLPPAATAMYCLRPTMKEVAGAFTPAPRLERPQLLAGAGVVGGELAVAFTVEHQAAGRGQHAADQRLRRVVLPGDLAGVEVDRGQPAPLLLARDHLEGAAQPQLAAAGILGGLDVVGHRLVQVGGIGQAQPRVDRPSATIRRHRWRQAACAHLPAWAAPTCSPAGSSRRRSGSATDRRDGARRRGRSCRRGSPPEWSCHPCPALPVRMTGLTASRSHTSCATYWKCAL